MTLKAVVDSIDDLDESLHSLYTQSGDKYILDVDGMVNIDDIENHEKTQGLKSALDKEREARKEFERQNRDLQRRQGQFTDEDIKELEALRDVKAKAEEERRRTAGEFDSWREEINQTHAQELEAQRKLTSSLQDQIRSDRVGRQIAEACAEHGAPADLMEAYIERHIKSEFNEDGSLAVSVLDGEGMRMVNGEGQPLGISGFVKKLADDKKFGQYFASKQKSGSGTPPQDRDGLPGGNGEKPKEAPQNTDGMSASQKAMHEKKQKIAAFREQQQQAQG